MAKLTRKEVECIIREAREKGITPDLSKADFKRINFNGGDLSRTNLSETDLSLAELVRTDLTKANLTGAILSGADLRRADLSGTTLDRAILNRTHLRGVKFSGTTLIGTDFTNGIVYETVFADVDLSTAKGLDAVEHRGPSYIDINTFQRSKGKIPEVFLRGVGVSDTFITYLTSLTSSAIQYYSCFISYSSKDEAFAQRLHADLQQKGVRCWFAPEDMKIGDKIRPRIDESIRIHDKLLLILSKQSINSTWVEKEVETAFEEERKRNQTVLFPVWLDEAVMETDQAWAADIRRTRHIGDFSQWKNHDVYQQAFERLLRDLKAEG